MNSNANSNNKTDRLSAFWDFKKFWGNTFQENHEVTWSNVYVLHSDIVQCAVDNLYIAGITNSKLISLHNSLTTAGTSNISFGFSRNSECNISSQDIIPNSHWFVAII